MSCGLMEINRKRELEAARLVAAAGDRHREIVAQRGGRRSSLRHAGLAQAVANPLPLRQIGRIVALGGGSETGHGEGRIKGQSGGGFGARLVQMDTSKAEGLPGVRAVLRYDDPEIMGKRTVGVHGMVEDILAGYAYFQGQMVGAVVVADTERYRR